MKHPDSHIGELVHIYGTHAVTEALRMRPSCVREVMFVSERNEAIFTLARAKSIKTHNLGGTLPRDIPKDAVHQGVIATLRVEQLVQDYNDFIQKLEITPKTGLVILGELQDPHNVGAIIRSAAAFGITGVILPEHNQAPITGAVIKVSAGMAFSVPLLTVGNVNQTIADLKERGFWMYGLVGAEGSDISKEVFDRPSVFIVGNEGTGIREKTREHCDMLLSIPIDPRCESLNASVSAAIAFYAWQMSTR